MGIDDYVGKTWKIITADVSLPDKAKKDHTFRFKKKPSPANHLAAPTIGGPSPWPDWSKSAPLIYVENDGKTDGVYGFLTISKITYLVHLKRAKSGQRKGLTCSYHSLTKAVTKAGMSDMGVWHAPE